MADSELKTFADKIGMKYVGDDFELLKARKHIKNFSLERITVNAEGTDIHLTIYEEPRDKPNSKIYIIGFNVYCLKDPNCYTGLDRNIMKNIPADQKILRARLRIQSALLRLYNEKDKQKKNQVGINTIYVGIVALSGKILWS